MKLELIDGIFADISFIRLLSDSEDPGNREDWDSIRVLRISARMERCAEYRRVADTFARDIFVDGNCRGGRCAGRAKGLGMSQGSGCIHSAIMRLRDIALARGATECVRVQMREMLQSSDSQDQIDALTLVVLFDPESFGAMRDELEERIEKCALSEDERLSRVAIQAMEALEGEPEPTNVLSLSNESRLESVLQIEVDGNAFPLVPGDFSQMYFVAKFGDRVGALKASDLQQFKGDIKIGKKNADGVSRLECRVDPQMLMRLITLKWRSVERGAEEASTESGSALTGTSGAAR